jgi:hypothetical protein
MKLKYYLRGMGVGILFSTIILSVAFHTTKKSQISDAEIIERAEELGMVNKGDVQMDDLLNPSTTPVAEQTSETTDETIGSEETKETNTEDMSTEVSNTVEQVTPEPTKEPTPAPTKTPVNEQSNEQTSDKADSDDNSSDAAVNTDESNKVFIKFEIKPGMTSEDVANLLKDKGVVEDAKAFNQYLRQNEYTTDINIGKYEIEKFASYAEIADTIVK